MFRAALSFQHQSATKAVRQATHLYNLTTMLKRVITIAPRAAGQISSIPIRTSIIHSTRPTSIASVSPRRNYHEKDEYTHYASIQPRYSSSLASLEAFKLTLPS